MTAAVTVSVGSLSYLTLSPDRAGESARRVAATASCRSVDAAIVAYITVNGKPPVSIKDLIPYVKGDITAYRIVQGVATGPGC